MGSVEWGDGNVWGVNWRTGFGSVEFCKIF